MSITEELHNGTNDGSQIDLVGLSRSEMEAVFDEIGLPRFRVKQVWHWIYHHGVREFSEMTTIAKGLQPKLAAGFMISRPGVTTEKTSTDGTRKWLLNFSDGKMAETAYTRGGSRSRLYFFAGRLHAYL